MSAFAMTRLILNRYRGRLLGLAALALLFLAVAAGASLFARDPHGGMDLNALFALGGFPLVSAMLLLGWTLGRFPLIATLVLLAGFFSADRATGLARLQAVRPLPLVAVYAAKLAVLAAVAFLLSALLLPLFDLLLLGEWAGGATLVLIASYLLVYGSLTVLLSVWTRGDAWIVALLAIAALAWHALLRGGMLDALPGGGVRFVNLVLPPQGAIFAIESAFAGVEPIPWLAFGYVAAYGAIVLALAGISLWRREI